MPLHRMAQPSNDYVEHDPHNTHTSRIPGSSSSSHSSSASSSTYTRYMPPPSSSSHIPMSSASIAPSSAFIDWPAAPRISFSKDSTKSGARSASHETMKDQIFEISESPARLSSSKSSPSEFEFSMSLQGQDSLYEQTMLAADELFHDGKLLPIYNTPPGVPTTEAVISRRRSSAEEYVMHAHAQELGRMKVEQHPISPKAPTCTSRWKELLGLRKVQIQDASIGSKLQHKTSYRSNGLAPGRRSVDSLKDPKGGLHHSEVRVLHCSRELKPSLQEAHSQHNAKEHKSRSDAHAHDVSHTLCAQNHNVNTSNSSLINQSELPLLSTSDPGLSPTTNLQTWKIDRGSRSSKGSDESERMVPDPPQSQCKGGGQAAVVKQKSRAKSPTKQIEQARPTNAAISLRRGGAGPKGMSPGRPSVGNRQTESSRSAMTTRLVVRGLDRSYSNPKLPTKKRPEQLRSGRQRAPTEGSRSLERSTSYSAGVRVTPVINVPMYITPGLRKGSKNGIFGLTQLFSSKKDKASNKLSSSAFHHQPHPEG